MVGNLDYDNQHSFLNIKLKNGKRKTNKIFKL